MPADSFFTEITLPQQKTYNGDIFPTILSPQPNTNTSVINNEVSVVAEAIRAQKPWLESLLHKTGAILFRGFPLTTASDFNDVVEAFDFEELPYIGGAAPRNKVVGRVSTANESPHDQKIPFHHEMAQVTKFPSKLFFFCEVEPGKGGETAIVLSHIVYERMNEKYPEFVERLEEKGLIYTRVLGEEDDLSSPIGRGWQSTFLTKDKSEAEKRAANVGTKIEWLEDGGAKTIMGPIAAIKVDQSRRRKIWFNSMVFAYTSWEDARNDPIKAVTFGDGKPVPADIVYDCVKILDEESVAIPWKKGDVLLIDNWAALHSRRPYNPPRRILASLCKAANVGTKIEWLEDGGAKTIMGPIAAIKVDQSRQRKIWFNSMVIAYTSWEDARNDPIKAITFGDGKPLPADIVHDCVKILEEESVAIPWKKGDVLLIDNWAALHSRRPYDPPRRILASLCK